MNPKICYYVFTAHKFTGRLMRIRFVFVRGIGAMLENFLMGFSYMAVLQAGAVEAKRRKKGKK